MGLWCGVVYCGVVCSVVVLVYYAIAGVVYFSVWCVEVWCGSAVRCDIVSWKGILLGGIAGVLLVLSCCCVGLVSYCRIKVVCIM